VSTLGRALHAEWTKLRSVQSSGWLLLGVAALTVGLGGLVMLGTKHDGCGSGDGCGVDVTRIALSGIYVGQIMAVLFGVLAVTSEYTTGTIRTTLAAVPKRWATFVAKATVVAGAVLLTALLAVVGSLLMARAVLPGNGFDLGQGYPPLTPTDATTLRVAGGTVLYLGLLALLSVGVALAVRSTAAAITTVLALLFAFPILTTLVTERHWHERLTEWAPMSAGLAVQASRDLDSMPIEPWQGLGVLAVYAAAALLLGGVALQWRDA
jgi:hypothetical protein